MIQNLNICLFPQPIIWGNKKTNIGTLVKTVEELHPGTDLLIIPEMFSTGFITSDKESVRVLAEKNTGETMNLVLELAKDKGIAIAGSFIADTGGSLFNRAFFAEPGGDIYFADKRHLFTMAGEAEVFSEGDSRLSVRYRGWNISMVICYDIRFPVWCRNVENQYDLLLAVANWPDTRIDAWNQLLKCRAIENLAYVCGVNCFGEDPKGNRYDGSSMAIDFKGKDITLSKEGSLLKYASLSYEKLERFRQKFPAWRDADSFKINTDY